MNFKGHVTGGVVVGAAIAGSALALSGPLELPVTPLELLQVFLVAVFFSLFPDLDISSIPQRWFFRAIFVILLILSYYNLFEEAALLALVAITPLLDHHRSWTHNVLAVLIFPVFLAALYEYLLVKDHFFSTWSMEEVGHHLKNHIWLVIACIGGWYTHLLLDTVKWFRPHKLHA